VTAAPQSPLSKALADIAQGVSSIHVWPMLGWLEIKQRYRRSLLGPFWVTISTATLIGGMGPLYGTLLGQKLATYFPHLAVSYIVWMLMASLMNDACTTFTIAEGLIKQIRMPLSIHVLRMVWRNFIIFLHQIPIVVAVLYFYPPPLHAGLLLVPVALLAIAVNALWMGLLLGMLCARFRDIPQIVASVVQVMFFLTPVLYHAGSLGRFDWAAKWNPLNHLLEIVRAPLLGHPVPYQSWAAVAILTCAGYAFAITVFARYRSRVAYWV